MTQVTLTADLLQKFSSSFEKDSKNVIAQNAAAKHGIKEIMTSQESLKGKVHVYNTSIPDECKPVTNQKASGRCWLFAALNAIRPFLTKKYDITEFEFSQSYLFFWDKIERTNYMLETFIATRNEPLDGRLMMFLLHDPYCDGGQWDMIVNLINKYGLVPKPYYPETQSSENSRNFNSIITNKLREYCHRLRSMAEASDEDLRSEKEKMLQEMYNICCICLGTPPTKFSWEYKSKSGYQCVPDLTPLSFYETIVKPLFDVDSKICLINDPRPEHPYMKLYTVQYLGNVVGGAPVRYVNLPVNDLKQYTIKALKAGKPVWFGCDVGAFFNRKHGMNDLTIYDTQATLGISCIGLDKSQRLKYGESLMTHAMSITAVQLKDTEGEAPVPVRWRVENSWGSDSGSSGYLMMTDDWFTEFVYEVVVDKALVPQEVIDVLKLEATVLPPWDPMGALAQPRNKL